MCKDREREASVEVSVKVMMTFVFGLKVDAFAK
jgi:hypothetical protein